MYENIASHASTSDSAEGETRRVQVDKRTKAEIAFEKSKEKKVLNKYHGKTVKVVSLFYGSLFLVLFTNEICTHFG